MSSQVFYGYKCPRCHSTADVDISMTVGGKPRNKPPCPSCGTEMEPNPKGNVIAMNVHCRNCSSMFGMINSSTCPECGEPFT